MWSDWLVFCDYGFSVSALWGPLAAPTVLLGFLLPWRKAIFSWLPLLTLNMEQLLSGLLRPAAAAPWRWGCSSRPPSLTWEVGKLLSAAAPALSQPGALSCYPWPWARGASSWPRFCASAQSVAAQKNIYFCLIDYAKAFDCVDHSKLWKILKEMGILDHLTCLLRNLYAGQEATVRLDMEQQTGSK